VEAVPGSTGAAHLEPPHRAEPQPGCSRSATPSCSRALRPGPRSARFPLAGARRADARHQTRDRGADLWFLRCPRGRVAKGGCSDLSTPSRAAPPGTSRSGIKVSHDLEPGGVGALGRSVPRDGENPKALAGLSRSAGWISWRLRAGVCSNTVRAWPGGAPLAGWRGPFRSRALSNIRAARERRRSAGAGQSGAGSRRRRRGAHLPRAVRVRPPRRARVEPGERAAGQV